jgi:hypothetical protein
LKGEQVDVDDEDEDLRDQNGSEHDGDRKHEQGDDDGDEEMEDAVTVEDEVINDEAEGSINGDEEHAVSIDDGGEQDESSDQEGGVEELEQSADDGWEQDEGSDQEAVSGNDSGTGNGSEDGSEDSFEDDTAFSDHFSRDSEVSEDSDIDLAAGADDETSSMNSYYESNAYDPTKLSREDVGWTGRSRVLAINMEWKGDKKAFLSGRGGYDDYVSAI